MGQVGFSASHQLGHNILWNKNWILTKKTNVFIFSNYIAMNFINFFYWFRRLGYSFNTFKKILFIWRSKRVKTRRRQRLNFFRSRKTWARNLLVQIKVLIFNSWSVFIVYDYNYLLVLSSIRTKSHISIFRNYFWFMYNDSVKRRQNKFILDKI